jgi:hypothetical protein
MRRGLVKKIASSVGMAALVTAAGWGLAPGSAYADRGGHGGGHGCDDGCFNNCFFGPGDFSGGRFRHHDDDLSGPFFRGHR